MTPELAYFLKVNIAFALLYAFYRLFFYKDTFFKLRRTTLMAFFGLALFYPLLNIQDWVQRQQPIVEVIYIYSAMLPEVTAKVAGTAPVDWLGWLVRSAGLLYQAMVALLFVRFLVQLGCILWLARGCGRQVIQGVPVYTLADPAGPFSFFSLIFVHPSSHTDKELEEILAHERTHVSQWHSVDVVVSELICALCWCNPFIWLLKREVRHNLEYLADHTVIEAGYDCKSYQYHLLGLAHHKPAVTLYNSFNVLHLKNRILMMNKKRSAAICRAKYLVFIPMIGILMLLSNMESMARLTSRLTRGMANGGEAVKESLMNEMSHLLPTATVRQEKEVTVVGAINAPTRPADQQSGKIPAKQEEKRPETIFTVVENMPQFPGGDAELLKFLATRIHYPREAQERGEQGRVICSFIVRKDGSITDAEVIRGVATLLDQEAIRVIGEMPRWTPGKQRGMPVSVKYTVPITFRLEDAAKMETNDYFTHVDKMPQFPGGDRKLLEYIARKVRYPVDSQNTGEQGRVICSFIINRDGYVSEGKVERGISPSLDAEALRVINDFPRWQPGEKNGKPVRVLYKVPITFKLS